MCALRTLAPIALVLAILAGATASGTGGATLTSISYDGATGTYVCIVAATGACANAPGRDASHAETLAITGKPESIHATLTSPSAFDTRWVVALAFAPTPGAHYEYADAYVATGTDPLRFTWDLRELALQAEYALVVSNGVVSHVAGVGVWRSVGTEFHVEGNVTSASS